MNYRMIGYLLSIILLIEAVLLTVPLGVSAYYGESVVPFVLTIALIVVISLPFAVFKPKNRRFYAKEGFVTVASGWILLSLFGSLPFMISGSIPNFFDAFFETVSGFTTTGATILGAIEPLPRGILFWRSLTHWIGGMGVLVFMLAILPSADGGTMYLMRAEVPGPTKGKLVPKMKYTALILYGIYFVLTVIMVIALLLCKLPLYDAVVSTMGTAGTGGFSVLNTSIGGYNNPAAEWVVAVFMVIFGINFNLYFLLLLGKIKDFFKNEELKVYLGICALSTAAIAVNIASRYDSISHCLRDAFFQVASIMSTSGFATENFDLWPELSKTILVSLMIFGACAGSTAGGLKISRVIILFKSIFKEIKHILRPRSVTTLRIDGEAVPEETVRTALGYFTIYVFIIIATTLTISVDGFDLTTNLTSTLACINNVGPGLSVVGPMGNFSQFSSFSKAILSLVMLIGRLEIMPMLILFSPMTWKKRVK